MSRSQIGAALSRSSDYQTAQITKPELVRACICGAVRQSCQCSIDNVKINKPSSSVEIDPDCQQTPDPYR